MVEPSKHLQVKLGPIVPSGFPVRVLTRPNHGECECIASLYMVACQCVYILHGSFVTLAGEWITAYQAEQWQHLKAVMKSTKLEGKRSKIIYPPTNTREASSVLHPVLNKLFLLLNCYVTSPGDLCVANISERDLMDVSESIPGGVVSFCRLQAVFIMWIPFTHSVQV